MGCSDLAELLDEPVTATAGRATAWLALEEPGPWGAPVEWRVVESKAIEELHHA